MRGGVVPPTMKKYWKEFLKRVWGDPEESKWVFIAYKGVTNQEFKQKSYKYPDDINNLVRDLEEYNEWADVYFCPHLFVSGETRRRDLSDYISVLWADKDSGAQSDLSPKPTICWQTSDNKYQALWFLNDKLNPEEAEQLNRRLTYKTKSDKGGWYLGKVLRLPGSINYKYTPPQRGAMLWEDGPEYDSAEFKPSETEEMITSEFSDNYKPMPKKVPSSSEVFMNYGRIIPSLAWRILSESPNKNQEWSEQLWKLERLLAEAGLPPTEIFAVVRESNWNKYARDNRPEEQLWVEVLKAVQDNQPVKEDEEQEELPWVSLDEIMIHAERPNWLVQDIWMDKNVGWIAGTGKSFKSFLSTDLALSIATGHPFLGKYPIIQPGPVLVVQEEDPLWRVAHRVQSMAHAKGITGLDIIANNQTWMMELKQNNIPIHFSISGGFSLTSDEKLDALERAVDRTRPKMVILDPMFMMVFGVDENRAFEMGEVLGRLKQLRDRYECSIALVHHYRKSSGESKERLYGSMAMYAWGENSLFVDRQEGSSIAYIAKDIKDAPSDSITAVNFRSLDDEYDIDVAEQDNQTKNTGRTSYEKIKNYIRSAGSVDRVSREMVMDNTGCKDRTVSKETKRLEDEGYISSVVRGKGGRTYYLATDKLLSELEAGTDTGGEFIF